MSLLIFKIKYDGDNLKLLNEVNKDLVKNGIEPFGVLYRASKKEYLAKIQKYGTDRMGYSGRKIWPYSKEIDRTIFHKDIIYASTAEEILLGEQTKRKEIQTSFKKLPTIDNPLLLIYDVNYFSKVRRKQYLFKDLKNKSRALLTIFLIEK